MNYDLSFIVTRLGAVQGALSCEPDISPSLSGLSLAKLPVVLLALMNLGLQRFEELTEYLYEHGANFDLEEVLEVLREFQTSTRYRDGSYDGLWRGNVSTGFTPNISITS